MWLDGLSCVVARAPLLTTGLGCLSSRLRRCSSQRGLRWRACGSSGCSATDASTLPGRHWLALHQLLNAPHFASGQVGLGARDVGLKVDLIMPILPDQLRLRTLGHQNKGETLLKRLASKS